MGEFSEQPPIDPSQNIATKSRTGTKNRTSLYDITPVDGKYQVTLPALISFEMEALVGTHIVTAETLEEANKIATDSKQEDLELFEQISLKKSFKDNFKIEITPDGKYFVNISQAHSNPYGEQYLLQVSGINFFESWIAARDFYLKQRESGERVIHNSLLDIQLTDTERIAFSDIDSFNPDVAPTNKPYEIPEIIEQYLLSETALENSGTTYKNTLLEKNWDKYLYSFVSKYINNDGKELASKLEIKSLNILTPKQAIELSTQIVIDYTKYNNNYAKSDGKTKADESTVLELLKEGLREQNTNNWPGNGVCRNFADSVKAVFEALKMNQTRFSLLNNTYCCFEGGLSDKFAPKRKKSNSPIELKPRGHAWNTFITLSKNGSANAVILDATWARQNLETKVVEGLDYTLTRMEPTVYEVGVTLNRLNDDTPDFENQFNKILSYYAKKIENPGQTGGLVTPNEEKQYYVSRVIDLMGKKGVPLDLPKPLIKAISEVYQENSDFIPVYSEIKTLYEINNTIEKKLTKEGEKELNDINFRNILSRYLEDKKSFLYQDAWPLIFEDKNLQYLVITEFEKTNLVKFRNIIEDCPNFRIRMREVRPYLVGEFSPIENSADAAELAYLINHIIIRSQIDNKFTISRYSHSKKDIEACFDFVRQHLREANPEKYESEFAAFDDYQIVKQFNSIMIKLTNAKLNP